MLPVRALCKMFFVTAICLGVLVHVALAEWGAQEAVAPSDPASQHASESTHHCIAVDGSGKVHVAWWDLRAHGRAIYYNSRTPGSGWGAQGLRLSSARVYDPENPSICCDTQGNAFAAWDVQGDTTNRTQVYYRRYSIATGWDSTDTMLNNADDLSSYCPSVATDDSGNVHIVWLRETKSNYYDRVIYRKYVPSQGWSDNVYLTDASQVSSPTGPTIVEDRGSLHVVWDRGDWSHLHVYYRRYTPGVGWDSVATEVDGGEGGSGPSVAVDPQGCVHVVWQTAGAGGGMDVAYRRWTPSSGWDQSVTTVASDPLLEYVTPDVAVDDLGRVHVVWQERSSTREIYERVWTPGTGWGDETQLTASLCGAGYAQLVADVWGSLHLIWEVCFAGGGQRVYYMLQGGAASGIPVVGDPVSREMPRLALQATPNPFRGETAISYILPKQAFTTLAVYDVAGRSVMELSRGPETAGSHIVSWNGQDAFGSPVQPGVYFLSLRAGSEKEVRPIVLFR